VDAVMLDRDFLGPVLEYRMEVAVEVLAQTAAVEVLRYFEQPFGRNRLLIGGLHNCRLRLLDYYDLAMPGRLASL